MSQERETAGPIIITQTTAEKLAQIVSRVERLEEEKKGIADDIKETYAEAKSFGLDPKILRNIVRTRKRDRQEVEEEQAITELYTDAIERSINTIRDSVARL